MSLNNSTYHSKTATLYSAALEEGDYHEKSDALVTWLMGLFTPFPEKMRINRAFVCSMYNAFNDLAYANILDVGAGPMPRGYEWAPNANILCVDHNPEIVKHSQRKIPVGSNMRYEVSSVDALPDKIKNGITQGFFSDAEPMAICSNAVLMFVSDEHIKSTFQFLYQWCEPGSILRVTTTAISSEENSFKAKMIGRLCDCINAPMHIRNIDRFCELLSPWKVKKGPMPCWQWLNWAPSKNTAGIGFDLYGVEFVK
ncbi:MAG: class I SAM-dependent methyltransferase [Cellvibrionaceae bacterium]|nr:class I SAM-dependent methyltransferase [Cellvibrionaceae bacterium]